MCPLIDQGSLCSESIEPHLLPLKVHACYPDFEPNSTRNSERMTPMGVRSTRKPTFPELHLRRLTVDEALYRLDQYLNAAFMANYWCVRIIHGKGTGKIREVVWKELAKSSLVKNFHLAPYGEGDTGVTIVELYQR